MIETGLVVALGLIVWWSNVGWRTRVWLTSNPLKVDIAIFTFLTVVHWGTFSGVMAATVGALVCSLFLKAARWAWGHRVKGKYMPGQWNIAHHLGG